MVLLMSWNWVVLVCGCCGELCCVGVVLVCCMVVIVVVYWVCVFMVVY